MNDRFYKRATLKCRDTIAHRITEVLRIQMYVASVMERT